MGHINWYENFFIRYEKFIYNCVQTNDHGLVSLMAYQPSWVIITFPKGIYPKANIIEWLVFELVYYSVPIQYINHNTTGTSLFVEE